MRSPKNNTTIQSLFRDLMHVSAGMLLGGVLLVVLGTIGFLQFESTYKGKVYPNVYIDGVSFGGKTKSEVEQYWAKKNTKYKDMQFEFVYESYIATISASEIQLGFDAALSAEQAYLVGRSGRWFSDFVAKFIKRTITITPYLHWNKDDIQNLITHISENINIPVEEPLFTFERNKVTAFRPAKPGRRVAAEQTLALFATTATSLPSSTESLIRISVPVETLNPSIATDKTNTYGIKELIGKGYSEFAGSIPGRVHNVILAASRLHGVLIPPGEVFSFNATVGDISAATGYQSAYIIKDGRTAWGDGGGVCQVSSTLFRAALSAGLPIVQRQAHAYRVHFYEDGGFKPGLDATVFSPSVDFQFRNNTPGHILIQAKPDSKKLTLTFEFYGTNDGRISEIVNHKILSQTPPPPPLYQDDPTLPSGTIKQVDFEAWGAKTTFDYKVRRGEEILENTTFVSNFRPWQAIYLKGVQ